MTVILDSLWSYLDVPPYSSLHFVGTALHDSMILQDIVVSSPCQLCLG